LNKKVVAKD